MAVPPAPPRGDHFTWSYWGSFAVLFAFVPSPQSESRGGGYSHTLPILVCAAQRGRDFQAPDLEQDIHFRGVF